jgi:hypothetical protein
MELPVFGKISLLGRPLHIVARTHSSRLASIFFSWILITFFASRNALFAAAQFQPRTFQVFNFFPSRRLLPQIFRVTQRWCDSGAQRTFPFRKMPNKTGTNHLTNRHERANQLFLLEALSPRSWSDVVYAPSSYCSFCFWKWDILFYDIIIVIQYRLNVISLQSTFIVVILPRLPLHSINA